MMSTLMYAGKSRSFFVRFVAVGLSVCLALSSASPVAAGAGARTLYLKNTKTNETARITYKVDGKFLAGGLAKLNTFFRDWRKNKSTNMDPRVIDLLWRVYARTGSNKPIHIISGYRSAGTNEGLRRAGRNVAKNSQHVQGRAIDFFIPGVKTSLLRAIALQEQYGGVGYYPSDGSPFIHIDVGTVRHWPGISRRNLSSIFPKGNSLHVPTGGKVLSGYGAMMKTYGREGLKPSLRSLSIVGSREEKALLASAAGTRSDSLLTAYAKTDFAPVIKVPKSSPVRPAHLPRARVMPILAELREQDKTRDIANSRAGSDESVAEVPESKPEAPIFASLPMLREAPRLQMVRTRPQTDNDKGRLVRSHKDFKQNFEHLDRGRLSADVGDMSVSLTKVYMATLFALQAQDLRR